MRGEGIAGFKTSSNNFFLQNFVPRYINILIIQERRSEIL